MLQHHRCAVVQRMRQRSGRVDPSQPKLLQRQRLEQRRRHSHRKARRSNIVAEIRAASARRSNTRPRYPRCVQRPSLQRRTAPASPQPLVHSAPIPRYSLSASRTSPLDASALRSHCDYCSVLQPPRTRRQLRPFEPLLWPPSNPSRSATRSARPAAPPAAAAAGILPGEMSPRSTCRRRRTAATTSVSSCINLRRCARTGSSPGRAVPVDQLPQLNPDIRHHARHVRGPNLLVRDLRDDRVLQAHAEAHQHQRRGTDDSLPPKNGNRRAAASLRQEPAPQTGSRDPACAPSSRPTRRTPRPRR